MTISFDQALGNQPQALAFRTLRSAVLAGNLVNQETPGYQPRDVSFQRLLEVEEAGLRPVRTDQQHLSFPVTVQSSPAMYVRTSLQTPVNGNAAEPEQDQLAFMHNAADFNRGLSFLRARLNGLYVAINGQ